MVCFFFFVGYIIINMVELQSHLDRAYHFLFRHFFIHPLTHCILVTPKCLLMQTLKNQIKFNIMWQLTRVYTVKTKTIFCEKNTILLGIISCEPLIYTMNHPKFIISNQKEKS